MLYALPAVFIILLILYLMPVSVNIAVKKDNKNDMAVIGLRTLYGLLKLKAEVPLMELTFENGKLAVKYRSEVPNRKRSKLYAGFTKLFSLAEGEGLFKLYKKTKNKLIPLIKYVLSKLKVYDFNLKLGLGMGDASVTAVLVGMVWIAVGCFIAASSGYIKIKKPSIAVVPVFGKFELYADFSCIISLRLGHIINAGIKAIPVLLSVAGSRNQINIC